MRNKLARVSQQAAKELRKWEPDLFRPHSSERRQGPKYFTSVQDQDGWDILTYYVD